MMALDDSYRLPDVTISDADVEMIGRLFFADGRDSLEIAEAVCVHECAVVRVLHALRNERRRADARESA
jgi:hypothetical protein